MCNKALNVKVVPADIIKATSIGTKKEDGDRPVLIQLARYNIKPQIFKNVQKLPKSDYKEVSIVHDMTKIEREQNKKMVTEAKKRTSEDKSGEYVYRVVGPPWARKIKQVAKPGVEVAPTVGQ
jgi:protein-tyrosine-phosphatase